MRYNKANQACHEACQNCYEEITNSFAEIYEKCTINHGCLDSYYNYGLLAFLNNNHDKAFELLLKTIELSEEQGELLEPNVYQNLSLICLEAMCYEKAISYLSKVIQQDPNNKEAYFHRDGETYH